MSQNTAVYGILHSRAELDNALSLLRRGGFPSEDVSVLLPQGLGEQTIVTEPATKGPEGTAAGGVVGAATGGMLGWLASVGALAIPGVGPFIAAGPAMALLAGMGAGAVLGGTAGALVGLGIPEFESKTYEGHLHRGGILVAVHAEDETSVKLAKQLLQDAGAEAISSAEEASTYFDKGIPQV